MAWFIVISAAALAVLSAWLFASARRSLAGLQESIRDSWPAVQAACARRQELIERIVALCRKPLAEFPHLLDRAMRTGAAVSEAAESANVLSLAAADQAHRAAVDELLARAALHPQLAGSAAFKALRERVATLDARIDAERERYNGAVGVFNLRRNAMPFRLAAFGIRRGDFL